MGVVEFFHHFFLWEGGDQVAGEKFYEGVAEPEEVAVTSKDFPVEFDGYYGEGGVL